MNKPNHDTVKNPEAKKPEPLKEADKPKLGSARINAELVYSILAKDYPTYDEFKILLENVSTGVLAKRYLHSGLPKVFEKEPHKYLAFRESLARVFRVASQNIAVMGSARFGFSTSPRKQEAGEKQLDENSDMDLVIIAPDFFQRALELFADFSFSALRDVSALKSDPDRKKDEKVEVSKNDLVAIRRRSKSLNFGYVNPADFEDGSIEKQAFYDMKREAGMLLLGTAPPGPISRVGAWIYRDWDAAERMYEFSFRQFGKSVGVNSADEQNSEDPLGDDD